MTREQLYNYGEPFGLKILHFIEEHGITSFKSKHIRCKVGLKQQQFSLGCRWLVDHGFIYKYGCPQSRWVVIE